MKFLIDNQLPVALSRLLGDRGFESRHVLDVGLDGASDPAIVEYAVREGFVIVSKDEDFSVLAALGRW